MIRLLISAGVAAVVLSGLSGVGIETPAPGAFLDPHNGLYRTARSAVAAEQQNIVVVGVDGLVTIFRDERGVPHIFAESDRDAVVALGYSVAADRLFQMDFVARAASGRLAEVLGEGAVRTDRFMRSIGMDWGAEKNAARIDARPGIERDLVSWFCKGVNAYIEQLDDHDLPLEFRLLDFRPDRCSTLQVARVLQFMTYDLTFRTDEAAYSVLQASMPPEDYHELFPEHAPVNAPIIPRSDHVAIDRPPVRRPVPAEWGSVVSRLATEHDAARRALGIGFEEGKGSNNWVISGGRSATGHPILAGDMHLRVTLPAIWYEAHLVTPDLNLYGVTVPGAPFLVEAFNDSLAWAFTNTGSDQIDHIALETNEEQTKYRVGGRWKSFEVVPDTIVVRGSAAVVDTLVYSEWGPVISDSRGALALRWVAHDSSRTLQALWGMGHAGGLEDFEAAIRTWDTPMQNIVYADVSGDIAIRSTGYLPIRSGGTGTGILEADREGDIWKGRVPFDELPYSRNPAQGFLASANQEPIGEAYPYYMGHDWRPVYRALRINELLSSKRIHTVEDAMSYQADVVAIHGRQLARRLGQVTCTDAKADQLRGELATWNGEMTLDSREPIAFDLLMNALERVAWDEEPFRIKRPHRAHLLRLLQGELDSKWADIASTAEVETVDALLCAALSDAKGQYEKESSTAVWGDVHHIVFRHLLSADPLEVLGRGPYSYPGWAETLSPGGGRLVTASASWRVVVDLSESPPRAHGVYPGGASGNPFSGNYAAQIPAYLSFEHYRLHNESNRDYFRTLERATTTTITPGASR